MKPESTVKGRKKKKRLKALVNAYTDWEPQERKADSLRLDKAMKQLQVIKFNLEILSKSCICYPFNA